MGVRFADRAHAGDALVAALAQLDLHDPVVIAIPRGGVAVAAPVADALDAPLDIAVVRKIGAPGNPELGLGAVGPTGPPWLDARLIERLRVADAYLVDAVARERAEAERRVTLYRPGPQIEVGGRDVVVVDDGIATGGTVAAAARLLRQLGPSRLVLAVPVAPPGAAKRLRPAYDEVVVLSTPSGFTAVGSWYVDFRQVGDADVAALLTRPRSR